MTKNSVDEVKIGNIEFKITVDSFKAIEVDFDELIKPCTVCKNGLSCFFRSSRSIKTAVQTIIGCGMQHHTETFLDLESWEFQKDFATLTIFDPTTTDPFNRILFEGLDKDATISLLVHYHSLFGSK